jgi:hypothetical protein
MERNQVLSRKRKIRKMKKRTCGIDTQMRNQQHYCRAPFNANAVALITAQHQRPRQACTRAVAIKSKLVRSVFRFPSHVDWRRGSIVIHGIRGDVSV